MDERPVGRRFSHVYVARGEPSDDSRRVRTRYIALIHQWPYNVRNFLSTELTKELGVRVSSSMKEIDQISVVDLLDSVTIIRFLLNDEEGGDFVDEIERIFREENLKYTVDPAGGVHFLVDAAFHTALDAGISGLDASKFVAARAALESIQPALDAGDTRGAVRATFDAAENVFKVLFGTARLGAAEIAKDLKASTDSRYTGAALNAHRLLLKAFGEWANAAHQYRHMEGVPDAPPPPLDLTILLVSQGISWVRWLISLDK